MQLLGPFSQVVTFANAPLRGPLDATHLGLIANGGILVEGGIIQDIGAYDALANANPKVETVWQNGPAVTMPGLVDCHTHACYAGSRALDFDLRIAGTPYLKIGKAGGGIKSTVAATRAADEDALAKSTLAHLQRMAGQGCTTVEVKSGYGLTLEDELKMLRAIQTAGSSAAVEVVPTCLAAHICPPEFEGRPNAYLEYVLSELLPMVMDRGLAKRVDIFIEETAFSAALALPYLQKAKSIGFELTVHADQFTAGSSATAIAAGALSADHLEASGLAEIAALAASNTVAVALPGASLGLGMRYAPARALLDAGCCLAIASDFNPGSAPMGHLLLHASVLAAAEKLTTAETLAATTYRASAALGLVDRGRLAAGQKTHLAVFEADDYREILYQQGRLKVGTYFG